MGDMGDVFRTMTEIRKDRHANWKENNIKILNMSGIQFIRRAESYLYRSTSLKVDFYISTGRWRRLYPLPQRTFTGGARVFLSWLKRQEI